MLVTKIPKLFASRLGLVTVSRLVSSSAINRTKNIPAGFAKIKESQKMFNLDNGLRVHQRGGMIDGMLYNLTLFVVFIGFIEYLRMLYALVYK